MELQFWEGEIKDLNTYPEFLFDKKLSVLANAVYAANYDLSNQLTGNQVFLEVGCGIDSYVKNNAPNIQWEGVDVYKFDSSGRPTIATKIASVHELPYDNDHFDVVLSNQSIEHWYEYGVSIQEGLAEICRVLKVGGRAVLNFPIHLHGKKEFVVGDFAQIDGFIDTKVYKLKSKSAFIDSNQSDYAGWRKCSLPDFLIARNGKSEKTSYVVEYELEKISNAHDTQRKIADDAPLNLLKRKSLFKRTLHYGVDVLAWRAFNKIAKKLLKTK